MSSFKGINAPRRILNPSTTSTQQEVREIQLSATPGTFLRAVVVRVFTDPDELTQAEIDDLQSQTLNGSLVENLPRNSILARIVSGGSDRRGIQPVIVYPFFSSHISLPVKAGEQVWIMYENPDAENLIPYWFCRIPEPEHVEDINYTHADRKFDRDVSISTKDMFDGVKDYKPSFQNGGGTQNSFTLKEEDDYEKIVESDPNREEVSLEPVPRFKKRPGDYVMQGSNNTLIVLGEERSSHRKSEEEKRGSSGAVDIVVGRSPSLPQPGQTPNGTQPPVIENERGYLEVDKNTKRSGNSKNSREGEFDYVNDLSRIKVSMKANCDRDFKFAQFVPAGIFNEINDIEQSPYAVIKSTEVRIAGRGSVRLIREDNNNPSGLYILPSGVVQIDGDKIVLGRGVSGGNGPGETEPMIRFSKHKETLENVIDTITSLLNQFSAAFVVPIAAPGNPHPGLAGQGNAAISAAIQKLNTIKLSIDSQKSDHIFGS